MSFTAPQRDRSQPVLPLAAMVDVLFLLLVFFMTTSIFREPDYMVEVSPPAIESGDASSSVARLLITVDGDGSIYIEEHKVKLDELRERLEKHHDTFPNEPVIIRGDENASHGQIMRVKDAVFQAEFRNVSEAVIRQER